MDERFVVLRSSPLSKTAVALLLLLMLVLTSISCAQEFSFHGVLLPGHAKTYEAFHEATKWWYTEAEMKWAQTKRETGIAPVGVSVSIPDSVIEDTFNFNSGDTVTLIRGGSIHGRGKIASIEAAYIPRAGDNQRMLFRVAGLEGAPDRDDYGLGDPYNTECDLYIIGDYEVEIIPPTTVIDTLMGIAVDQIADYFRLHENSRETRRAFLWPVPDALFMPDQLEFNLVMGCTFRTSEMLLDSDDMPDYVIEANSLAGDKDPFWRFSFIKLTSIDDLYFIAGAQFDYVFKVDGKSYGLFRVQSWGKGIRGWEVVRFDPAHTVVGTVFKDYSRSD